MHHAKLFYAHYRVARVYASRPKAVRIALWFTRAQRKGELVKGLDIQPTKPWPR